MRAKQGTGANFAAFANFGPVPFLPPAPKLIHINLKQNAFPRDSMKTRQLTCRHPPQCLKPNLPSTPPVLPFCRDSFQRPKFFDN